MVIFERCYPILPPASDKGHDERVFSLLEKAAAAGERCPTNAAIAVQIRDCGFRIAAGSIPTIMRRLTRQGRIIVRVYGNNWRGITICTGPHANKSTLEPPHGGKPHLIIDLAERAERDERAKRSAP